MEITGWVAIAAMVALNGETAVSANDKLHRTEAECVVTLESIRPRVEAADFIAAYGMVCVKVTVKDKPAGKPS